MMDKKKIREGLLEGLVEKMLHFAGSKPEMEMEESPKEESKEDGEDMVDKLGEKPKASIEVLSIEAKPKNGKLANGKMDENFLDDLLPPKKKKV